MKTTTKTKSKRKGYVRGAPSAAVVEKTFQLWLGPLRGQYCRFMREKAELLDMWKMATDSRAPHGAQVAAAKRVSAIIVHIVTERPRWDHHAVQHFNHGHSVQAFLDCCDEEDGMHDR